MTEDVKISKIIELANKYNLKVCKYIFNPQLDLKLSCELLVAKVKYTTFDDVVNIEMPKKYISDLLSESIVCQGWWQPQGLFSFERKIKFLLENYKKCVVEYRKFALENDFD